MWNRGILQAKRVQTHLYAIADSNNYTFGKLSVNRTIISIKNIKRDMITVGILLLFAILVTCAGITYHDDRTDSLLNTHMKSLIVHMVSAYDVYSVQITTLMHSGLVAVIVPNPAFAAQNMDIVTITDIHNGNGFEVGGPWDVATYEDNTGNIYAVVLARMADAVQIIDITDPANPSAVSTLRDNDELALDDPVAIAIYDYEDTVYALIAVHNGNAFQIIDITDPANPSVVVTLEDNNDFGLDGPLGFSIYEDHGSENVYAIIAVHFSDVVHIVDITDPANPSVVTSIKDGGDFALDGPGGVAVYNYYDDHISDTAIYAIVIVYDTDAIQIIDITDPIHPSAVTTIWNGDNDDNGEEFTLDKPWGVVMHEGLDSAFAIVMTQRGNTIQIIDVTDPINPFVAVTLRDDEGFEVATPVSFEIYEDGNRTYAMITSLVNSTVQIVDITDPINPSIVATLQNEYGFDIKGPAGVAIYEDSNNNGTHAVITGFASNTTKIVQIGATGMMTESSLSDEDALNDNESQETLVQDMVEEEVGEEEVLKDNDDKGGGCLIATAAYGTEMAPQIQELRGIRDNIILTTESGSVFMQEFNHVYYSFSPTIADMQRQSHTFNMAINILILPMISTLSIMTLADDDDDNSSEYAVVSLGVLVVTLNLGLYVGLPAFVGLWIRKRIQHRVIKWR